MITASQKKGDAVIILRISRKWRANTKGTIFCNRV